MTLFHLFDLFNASPLTQLTVLAPLILLFLGLIGFSLWRLTRQKSLKTQPGWFILVTLAAYFVFVLLMLGLAPAGISFGNPVPVIIILGVLYLFSLAAGLILLLGWQRFARLRGKGRLPVVLYLTGHLALLAVFFYGFYIEPDWLEVTRTQVPQARLAPGTPPIKIALISDIHMERWTRREDEVLAKLNEAQPDLLLVAGDHINTDFYTPAAYADLQRFFKGLHAKYGVYAVAGTVDRLEETRQALEGSEVQLLDDRVATVQLYGQSISIIGVTTHYTQDGEVMARLAADLPTSDLKILLYHQPDLVPEAAASGIDLYLAGHPHGGQISLPFFGPLYTASKFGRAYSAGLYNLAGPADTRLYITRGIGMEGNNMLRMRFLARPEVSLITLVPA